MSSAAGIAEAIGVVGKKKVLPYRLKRRPSSGASRKSAVPPMGGIAAALHRLAGTLLCVLAGMALRMALRVPGVLASPGTASPTGERQTAVKMTRARKRVLEASGIRRPSGQVKSPKAGVGPSVIKGLLAEGVIEAVELPGFQRFDAPDLERKGISLSVS